MIHAEYNLKKTTENERTLTSGSNETHAEVPRAYTGLNAITNFLSDSISEALTDLVGTRACEAILDNMERNHSVARNEIPDHLDELFVLFEHHFGPASAQVIGRRITKRAYSKLDWEFHPKPNFEFNDYMEEIKMRLAKAILDRAKVSKGHFD